MQHLQVTWWKWLAGLVALLLSGAGFRIAGQLEIAGPDTTFNGPGFLQVISSNNSPNEASVWITNAILRHSGGVDNLTFSIAGGSNGLPYDVFAAPELTTPLSAEVWNWMGQGYQGVTYSLPVLADSPTFLVLGTPVDSDGDGLTDAYELLVSHSNPYAANSINPSMPDGWAVQWALNPFAIYDQQDNPTAPQVRLGYWRFNTLSYQGEAGQMPIVNQGAVSVPAWSGNAVSLTNTDTGSQLLYNVFETDGTTNFACNNGTIRFWFQPNWNTGDTNAPTNGATFFRAGFNPVGYWGLSLVNNGTNPAGLMQLGIASNQYLQGNTFQYGALNGVPINFQSNLWYQITLTYSPSNVALYTNGALLATGNMPPTVMGGYGSQFQMGNGISFYPSQIYLDAGFSFGSLAGQPCAVRGQLDELETFNYPLSPQEVAAGFPTFAGSTYNVMTDSDYDGRSDLLEILVDGTNPNDARSVAQCRLGYWRFNSPSLIAEQGQLPLSYTDVSLSSDVSGTALNISADPASHVTYWDVFTNGWANINCRQGCVRFWFKPNWNGRPPGTAPFVYLGNTNPAVSQWALMANANGSISLITASNNVTLTNLTCPPLSFDSGHWIQLTLNYGQTGTSLYTNGTLAASGSPITLWPALADRNRGMVIGNTTAYNNSINGQFDELETFNYQLNPTNILANFQSVQLVDSDLDGIADVLEDLQFPASRTFLGSPVAVTGTIEAEQFDMGGRGIAYYNVATNPPSAYRPSGMLITNCDDLGLGYCLDQMRAGEWAQYTINILAGQNYAIETRISGIGTNGVFECEFTGNGFYTNTGPLVVTTTNWTNISAVVGLPTGICAMKLHCLTNGSDGAHVGKFNYISVYPSWGPTTSGNFTNAVSAAVLSTNNDWQDAYNNATAIQNAINALPSGGGTVLLPSGTFYVSPAGPNETNRNYLNSALLVWSNNIAIAGAGKTNTTLIAYNRATTIVFFGGDTNNNVYQCTNFTLRDLTLEAQPHVAVHNGTNTQYEIGQYSPPGFEVLGALTTFQGASSFSENILITNCRFLFGDFCIVLASSISNCLITHCDFDIWGSTNVYTGYVNNYPSNSLHTVKYRGSVGIYDGGSPVYNVVITDNTYNGNTNLVASTNNPYGYVNTGIFQYFAPDGFIYFQSGGNFFVARNTILNNALEGVQLEAGPNSVVGNTFQTWINNPSCCALLAANGGWTALTGYDPVNFSTTFIGNQIYGGRNGDSSPDVFASRQYSVTVSGNSFALYPPLPQTGDNPGSAAYVKYCTSANVLGNTLLFGGHGVQFDVGCVNALIMNNNFANVTYRGIGLESGGASLQHALIANNILGQGSTFHVQLPYTNSAGWFLVHNQYLNASSNSVPPFIDPLGSAAHISN